MKVSIPVVISSIKTRKDRSFNLSLDTAYEMTAEDATILFALRQTQAWAVLSSEDDITEQDVPEVKPDAELTSKSPSERLRAVLFVYWKQQKSSRKWEQFYLEQMDRLIELVKDKLEPGE